MNSECSPAWEPAVEIINPGGASPIILICEHASSYIPARYERLGLSEVEACSHIAWDIGAEEVVRHLSHMLDAPAFVATHSRLLIDLNRPTETNSSIAIRSESTEVPGNYNLGLDERRDRIHFLFHPFHNAVASYLDQRTAYERAESLRIVCVHSFTRVYLGERRLWDVGILFERAETWGTQLVRRIGASGDLITGANVPYSIGPEWDYAVPVHGDARGIDALLIEICNDLIDSPEGALSMAQCIVKAL